MHVNIAERHWVASGRNGDEIAFKSFARVGPLERRHLPDQRASSFCFLFAEQTHANSSKMVALVAGLKAPASALRYVGLRFSLG